MNRNTTRVTAVVGTTMALVIAGTAAVSAAGPRDRDDRGMGRRRHPHEYRGIPADRYQRRQRRSRRSQSPLLDEPPFPSRTVSVTVNDASSMVVVIVDPNIPAGFALLPRSMGISISEPSTIEIRMAEGQLA